MGNEFSPRWPIGQVPTPMMQQQQSGVIGPVAKKKKKKPVVVAQETVSVSAPKINPIDVISPPRRK